MVFTVDNLSDNLELLSLNSNEAELKIEKIEKIRQIELEFMPVFQLICEKEWENQFKTPAENALDKFCESKFSICHANYIDIFKLALMSEFWAEVNFAQNNTTPNGIFSLNQDLQVF